MCAATRQAWLAAYPTSRSLFRIAWISAEELKKEAVMLKTWTIYTP